jgi:prevent-host-death family protein
MPYVDDELYKWYRMSVMSKLAEHIMTTGVRTYTASEARNRFADVFDEAFYGGGPVIIEKSSRSVAVVSLDMLAALTDEESKEDAKRAREALKEFLNRGGKPWKDLKKEL